MIIRAASPTDHGTIQDIAQRTWPVAYGRILSPGQLAYMLASMYSLAAIGEQCDRQGHRYVLALHEDMAVGFASCSHDHLGRAVRGSTSCTSYRKHKGPVRAVHCWNMCPLRRGKQVTGRSN